MAYITSKNFERFLEALNKDYQVFAPVKKGEQRFYKRLDADFGDILVGEVRAFEPVKAFFTRAREEVADGFKPDIPHAADKPFAIVGVKSCDLKGFKIQDHVFKNHDYADPFYIKNREENLIISADCTCAIETCFCLALGVDPYPTEGFDINLSEIDEGYLLETGSKKGKAVIEKYSSLFQETNERFIPRRDKVRKKVVQEVEKNIKENEVPDEKIFDGIIEKNFESRIWEEEAETCVECGACTVICPTCHCFFLYDQKDEKKMARFRTWDSCMIKDYARVAGGENPRAKLWMRLRNRFDKKFDFFPKVADVYACTGCGRCISACPAKIDIRKVLKRLVKGDEKA
ncbi:MAG: 4Fe-4S dicluster domain-containing protein [Candidatus Omnitrophica bacterium]|nr:4Fe-4S dicluster domain-containing protein [Candidatus Omnitrophota bacterium]